jgi:hypothetical protein
MRKELAKTDGERKRYQAHFDRIGKKTNFKGYSEDTILLKNILELETNRVVADHVWFTFTQGFMKAAINPGDRIEFEARSKRYEKGYVNKPLRINSQTSDYKLSNPTKIRKVV